MEIQMPDETNFLSSRFTSWVNHLKGCNSLGEVINNSSKFTCNEKEFYLVPFSKLDLVDDYSIQLLKVWRETNQFAYPTRFQVTIEGTKQWLEKGVLLNDDRILFWVVNTNFEKLGHIGVVKVLNKNQLEIDNVLRGVSGVPGLMAKAMNTLEVLVEEEFSLENITLRVLESNNHAVRFYEKLDYSVNEVIPLIEVRNGENLNLIPGSPPSDNFLTMTKSLLDLRNTPEEILTAGPSISNLEVSYVHDAVSTGWNYHHSDYITRFENSFAEYVGAKYAMATSSCSGALHLALLALGIGPGDEVIVPDVTWVATASAVMYTGAKPVFADINVDDWTINLDSIKSLINDRTKAIMPVHLYGYGAAMAQIMEIARDNNLHVVEDAAPAIGTEIDGKRAGTFGDFGCFSFQGAKLLVTGEGGMLVTDSKELFKRAKKDQDHGRKPGTFWIDELGHKYKMNNITAALGLAQIERADNQIFRKRRINRWYTENLSEIGSISFQKESQGTQSICWMTSFTLNDDTLISRDELISCLKNERIDSRPVFPAISQYPIWKYEATTQPNAKKIGATGINLPSGVLLSQSAIEKVCLSIRKAILT
jgi:perosamine synthetase